jgi:hypothetical protein
MEFHGFILGSLDIRKSCGCVGPEPPVTERLLFGPHLG